MFAKCKQKLLVSCKRIITVIFETYYCYYREKKWNTAAGCSASLDHANLATTELMHTKLISD